MSIGVIATTILLIITIGLYIYTVKYQLRHK